MQANQQQQLDAVDKKLLNEIQWVFPLVDRPYLEIAKRYDISEEDVMRRIAFMKNMGIIRQINAIFDTRRLGYKSALVAFAVRPDKLVPTDKVKHLNQEKVQLSERDREFIRELQKDLAVVPEPLKELANSLDVTTAE